MTNHSIYRALRPLSEAEYPSVKTDAENDLEWLMYQLQQKTKKERSDFFRRIDLQSNILSESKVSFLFFFDLLEKLFYENKEKKQPDDSLNIKEKIAAIKGYIAWRLEPINHLEFNSFFQVENEVRMFLYYSNEYMLAQYRYNRKWYDFLTLWRWKAFKSAYASECRLLMRRVFFQSQASSWSISQHSFFFIGALLGGLGSTAFIATTVATILMTLKIALPPLGLVIGLSIFIGICLAVSWGYYGRGPVDMVKSWLWGHAHDWINIHKIHLDAEKTQFTHAFIEKEKQKEAKENEALAQEIEKVAKSANTETGKILNDKATLLRQKTKGNLFENIEATPRSSSKLRPSIPSAFMGSSSKEPEAPTKEDLLQRFELLTKKNAALQERLAQQTQEIEFLRMQLGL